MSIDEIAAELVSLLRQKNLRIVFAESCTGGLVSATLTKFPGVSDILCGSAVTYVDEVKSHWLGVDPETIAAKTAVSDDVARQMAAGVLRKTTVADIAVSITGHLGPDAPAEFDGVVFVGFATRRDSMTAQVESKRFRLNESGRASRHIEAAQALLRFATEELKRQISNSSF